MHSCPVTPWYWGHLPGSPYSFAYRADAMLPLGLRGWHGVAGRQGRQAINILYRGEHPDLKRKASKPEAWYRVLGSVLEEFTPGG